MQYLLAVYLNEKLWSELPDPEKECVWDECHSYGHELAESGHLLGGAPLQPPSTARTLRRVQGKSMVTDGPFAETKEVLAGYHLLECKSIEEAVALGERFPGLRVGLAVEVRPVLEERLLPRARDQAAEIDVGGGMPA